jgi:hypothetical protein
LFDEIRFGNKVKLLNAKKVKIGLFISGESLKKKDTTTDSMKIIASCRSTFSAGYILMDSIRRLGLSGTSMSSAQCSTIRSRLFKIAASVSVSVRRILFSLPSGSSFQSLWLRVYDRLRFEHLWENLPLPSD